MRRLKFGFLTNLTLRKKLVFVYVCGVMIPMSVLSIVYCMLFVNSARNNMKDELEFEISEIGSAVGKSINTVRSISDIIYYDLELMRTLNLTEGSINDFRNAASKIDNISHYCLTNEFVEKITIFTYNDKLYRSECLSKISELDETCEWLRKFENSGKEFSVVPYDEISENRKVISVVRRLNYYGNTKDVLKIDISYQYLSNLLDYTKYNSQVWLVDKENHVIVGNSNGSDFSEKNSRSYIEKSIDFPNGYKLRCDYQINLSGNNQNEIIFIVITICLVMFLSLSVFFVIIRPIIQKLNELRIAMGEMQHEKFQLIKEDEFGNDEIGVLVKEYNCTVRKMDTLINEIYQHKLRQAEILSEKNKAKFMLLQSQIHPHFIFNTFELMRMNSIKCGDEKSSELLWNMSVILRNVISWKEDMILLSEEMKMVDAFIALSVFNFENQLAVETDITDAALKCFIPKMSLQVFVENAIRHGLENVSHERKLRIKAFCTEEHLIISISDNGIGIEQDMVDAINSGELSQIKSVSGIGISNVVERLRIYFGDDTHIRVSSLANEKTEFILKLPIKIKSR